MLAARGCTFKIRFNIFENGVRAYFRREKSTLGDLQVTGARRTLPFIFSNAILPSVFYKLSFAGIFVLEVAKDACTARHPKIPGLLQLVQDDSLFTAAAGENRIQRGRSSAFLWPWLLRIYPASAEFACQVDRDSPGERYQGAVVLRVRFRAEVRKRQHWDGFYGNTSETTSVRLRRRCGRLNCRRDRSSCRRLWRGLRLRCRHC
jgi:hypothetical protein